jgi:amino acid transporter/mannitol/fructose-specific phosphotransferase system IIA component (Ntr-type)
MISSGLFVLPGLAHAEAGPAVVISYALAGVLAISGTLSIAELTTAMPKAGGDYFYISRGMGPAVGTVSGLLSWFSLTLKSAFALVGLMAFVQLIVDVPEGYRYLVTHGAGVVLCAAFVGLNLAGAREAARLQVALVVGLFALMALYVVRGLPEVQMSRLEPFAPYGAKSVFATAGLVFVAYGGLLNIASVAEESRNPGRTIPRGVIFSLLAVSVAYTLLIFITSGVLPASELDRSLTPISDGAAAFMGRGGMIAMSIAAICAFLTTANAGILAASRYLLALSRDKMLPEPLGRTSRREVPFVAVLITGGLAAAALFVKLKILVEAASIVFMLSFMLTNASVIVLRESRVQNYRPSFRAPLYPWLQIGGIIALAFVIVEMGEEAFLILAGLVVGGIAAYWFYGRKRTQQESALLLLLERITARDLASGRLETELKAIIRQRDEIVTDRFDAVIENAAVLDVKEPLALGELFERVGEKLGHRLRVPPTELAGLLLDRERDTSTVIPPGVAIPHVVVPGEGRFEVALVRSAEGVFFAEDKPPVRAAFVLIGTRDERNFHLRALTAIAQIVRDPSFLDRWQTARGPQALRDLFLLGTRTRER